MNDPKEAFDVFKRHLKDLRIFINGYSGLFRKLHPLNKLPIARRKITPVKKPYLISASVGGGLRIPHTLSEKFDESEK